jgi:hypothetical protein
MIVMRDEIATTMRLLGVTRLDQLGPHLVSQFLLPSKVFTSTRFPPVSSLSDTAKTKRIGEGKWINGAKNMMSWRWNQR